MQANSVQRGLKTHRRDVSFIVCLFALAIWGAKLPAPMSAVTSRYLYVWTGDHDRKDSDFLAVIDIQPTGSRYGRVITTVPVGESGLYPHHTEHEFSGNALFANGFAANKTFIFNFHDPVTPRVVSSFQNAGELTFLHSMTRLANGHVIATYQGKGAENRAPGGLAELDADGKTVRWATAADTVPDTNALRPYSLAVVPALDRIVVGLAEMGVPSWHSVSHTMDHADGGGHYIQVWRLSDFKILKTIDVPAAPNGRSHRQPNEPRVLTDGKTVLVGTGLCGLYAVEQLETTDPQLRLVYSTQGAGCSVPVVVGQYWVQSNAMMKQVYSLDVSNLQRVHEVSSLQFDTKQAPHWLSTDGSRIAIVNANPDVAEHRLWLATIDAATGALTLDKDFRSEGSSVPGFNFDEITWPHGASGAAFPHGTVFRQ